MTNHPMRNDRARSKHALLWLGFPVLLACALTHIVVTIACDTCFHEEQRTLYRLDPERVSALDTAGQFLSAFPVPPLYQWITDVALAHDIELLALHRGLMLGATVLFLLPNGVLGWRTYRCLGALTCVTIAATLPLFSYQINSATSHAFGFSLLSWALVAALARSTWPLAALAILTPLVYVPLAPVTGLMLMYKVWGSRRSKEFASHVLLLAIVGIVVLSLFWMQLQPINGYGESLLPGASTDRFPENGEQGRLHGSATRPLFYSIAVFVAQFAEWVPAAIILFVTVAFIVLCFIGFRGLPGDLKTSVGSLVSAGLICFVAVYLYRADLSYRYFIYPIYSAVPILVTAAILAVSGRYARTSWSRIGLYCAFLASLATFISFDPAPRGLRLILDAPARSLMQFVRSTPRDSLIAAWPRAEHTDLIPYVGERPLLAFYKAHYTMYEGYLLEMRERVNTLIDAYLSTDPKDLIALHCRYGVTHVVFDQRHFADLTLQPTYFAPFDDRIRAHFDRTPSATMLGAAPPPEWIVHQAAPYNVIALGRIPGHNDCK